jgi:transaldolase / glucose-6-phosphate isomerase
MTRPDSAPTQPEINPLTFSLPAALSEAVTGALDEWRARDGVRRLWARDAALWTNADEAQWLGWLTVVGEQLDNLSALTAFADEVRDAGFAHALLLGMGGSSLCPEVLRMTFGCVDGFPELHVLDSTDPAQVIARENEIDLAGTLFIVASKSGTTLEPNVFNQYFYDRVKQAVGAEAAGSRFIAITDPGSKMQQVAERDRFRRVFFGLPNIGGRYSALSNFGMVPAAAMGLDVARFLRGARAMMEACGAEVDAHDNPGVVLGAILGVAAKQGRDKLTVIASPGIYDLGAWLEQLVAESTGKNGRAIIPVDREALGAPGVYGGDRLFAYLRLEGAADEAQDAGVDALEKAGHPVARISVRDVYNLGQEFFRWEVATAVAGALMGINPFDQPDVEASKVETRKLTTEYEETGALPGERPFFAGDGVKLFTDEKNAAELRRLAGGDESLAAFVKAHLSRLGAGDYFALLAYVEMNDAHEAALQEVRHVVRDAKGVATCLGFGPRFLHSTGQAYKGGPNTGVFLQITCDDAADLPVPGQQYTFGVVKAAQARGDFQVLIERGRRALRAHLGADVEAGLDALRDAVVRALS